MLSVSLLPSSFAKATSIKAIYGTSSKGDYVCVYPFSLSKGRNLTGNRELKSEVFFCIFFVLSVSENNVEEEGVVSVCVGL